MSDEALLGLYVPGAKVYATNPKRGPGNPEWVQGLVLARNGECMLG
jgi:hypothetical protein